MLFLIIRHTIYGIIILHTLENRWLFEVMLSSWTFWCIVLAITINLKKYLILERDFLWKGIFISYCKRSSTVVTEATIILFYNANGYLARYLETVNERLIQSFCILIQSFCIFQMKHISRCPSRLWRNWIGVWINWKPSKRTDPFQTWPRQRYTLYDIVHEINKIIFNNNQLY